MDEEFLDHFIRSANRAHRISHVRDAGSFKFRAAPFSDPTGDYRLCGVWIPQIYSRPPILVQIPAFDTSGCCMACLASALMKLFPAEHSFTITEVHSFGHMECQAFVSGPVQMSSTQQKGAASAWFL